MMHRDSETPPSRPLATPPAGSVVSAAAPEILYRGTMRHTASLGRYLLWAVVSVAGGALAWVLTGAGVLAGAPLWVLGLAGLPGLVGVFLRQVTTRYTISERRVETEKGVLTTSVESLELWRVVDIRYRRTLFDRLTGNASIILVGTDQSDRELMLYGLPHHRRLFEQLRDAIQTSRLSSRPMEFVGEGSALESLR